MDEQSEHQITNEELARYVEEVRTIKRALVEAEGSFRIFHWFYLLSGLFVLAGTAVNWALARSMHLSINQALIYIWVPVLFLVGVVETVGWIRKSSRDRVPIFAPAFVKYIVAFSGYFIGLFVLAFLFIRPGMPVPGIVLVLVGMGFCIPVQYTHFGFVLEALFLLAAGVLFVLLNLQAPADYVVVGVLVAASLFVAGIIELALSRKVHG